MRTKWGKKTCAATYHHAVVQPRECAAPRRAGLENIPFQLTAPRRAAVGAAASHGPPCSGNPPASTCERRRRRARAFSDLASLPTRRHMIVRLRPAAALSPLIPLTIIVVSFAFDCSETKQPFSPCAQSWSSPQFDSPEPLLGSFRRMPSLAVRLSTVISEPQVPEVVKYKTQVWTREACGIHRHERLNLAKQREHR